MNNYLILLITYTKQERFNMKKDFKMIINEEEGWFSLIPENKRNKAKNYKSITEILKKKYNKNFYDFEDFCDVMLKIKRKEQNEK